MQKIFCFGNEHIPGDEKAKVLAQKIQHPRFQFIMAESPFTILNENHQIIILDTIKGLEKTQLLHTIEALSLAPSLTCHDLDLSFYLKLMQETGKIKKVKIIGLPHREKNLQKLQKEVEHLLKKI